MPLADKIQFLGLHACTTEAGCPKSNEVPNGCPIWRNEIWHDEDEKPQHALGCGYIVDAQRERWVAGRALQAAQQSQRAEEAALQVTSVLKQGLNLIKEYKRKALSGVDQRRLQTDQEGDGTNG